MLLHRRQGGHRLERRPRRIRPVGRPIQRRRVLRLCGLVRQTCSGELGLGHVAGVHRRVVGRGRRHRENGAVLGIEGDDRAAACVPLLVRLREMDAVLQRLLRGLLELQVDGEADVVARLRDRRRLETAARPAERVDVHACASCHTAQVRVVRRLHPALADLVAGAIALLQATRQLGRGDFPDVAEHLRRERVVRVVADERAPRRDARELRRVLVQIEDHRVARRLAHGHRRDEVVGGAPRFDARGDLVQRHARELRDRAQLGIAGRVHLRQVGRPQQDRGGGRVRHERHAGAVEDLAARRLHAHRAERVCSRLVDVLRPSEHLQRPEAEEEDGENDEHRDTEDAHPPEEPRIRPVGLDDALARRQEALRARAFFRRRASQAAAPRSRSPHAPAAGGAGARARTSARSARGS